MQDVSRSFVHGSQYEVSNCDIGSADCQSHISNLYANVHLRVEPCEGMNTNTTNRYEGLQIHVAISSFFPVW